MSKLTKNQKSVAEKVEAGKAYTLEEASKLVKEITTTKFDASVDVDVRLGVDPRKANQMVRGVVSLPNGTGKVTRVLCLCTPDQEAAAKEAGADYVGLDEYVEKIKGGWTDVDVIITMPSCMGKLGPLGRVLGPRGLMPNPKSGTVTMDVAKAVKEVKQGKIDFKVDKAGIIHTSIGKVSMTAEQIYGNAKEFISTVIKLKPAAAKGTYIKSIFISSTMSKGVKIEIIAELGEKLKNYPHFYLVDVTGLNAEATSSLRRKCFKSEINMVVVKNKLLHKAFEASDVDFEPLYGSLKGNTAVLFTQTANVPAKMLKEYKKEGIPALKAAYVEETLFVGADKLEELAALKSKNEVIAEVVALLQSPAKNVVSALQSGAGTIHGVLKTLGERAE